MWEFHDWRHTGITNAAAAGMSPIKIMQMAGHSDFKTTQRYIDLAGVVFADEVKLLRDWYGAPGTKNRYHVAVGERESANLNGIAAFLARSS